MRNKKFAILWLMLAAIVATGGLLPVGVAAADSGSSLEYKIMAKDASLIRKVTGPVTSDVMGVPASPVDSFIWGGGDDIKSIEGSAQVKVDPVANTGEIIAQWEDENGKWEYKQTVFAAPPHPTGLIASPGAGHTQLIEDDPVATNVYLHGGTTAGGPVLPTIFNLLTTWGPAEITLNGEPFVNPFDGPAPLWAGHTMLTEGVRNDDGQVLNEDGSIFNMMDPVHGVTYDDKLQFHVVFHDALGPAMTDNVPPPLSFFYHVTFSDVELEVSGSN